MSPVRAKDGDGGIVPFPKSEAGTRSSRSGPEGPATAETESLMEDLRFLLSVTEEDDRLIQAIRRTMSPFAASVLMRRGIKYPQDQDDSASS